MTGPKVTIEPVRTFCRLRPSIVVEDGGESNSSSRSRYSELHARFVEHCRHEVVSREVENEPGFTLRLFEPHFVTLPSNMSRIDSSSNFVFDYVLEESVSQSDVFDIVARPLLDSFLTGMNGCIFCYGQTGAGKTWTMSGSDSYQSRGLIQRSIEALFPTNSSLSISYMEIYNEQAFDLLAPEGTPRVVFREDTTGTIQYENLSIHRIDNPEMALDLFLSGNLNRIVAATPMNQVSSRSHCVFTVYFELTDQLSVTRSKLHFVDLAGSERILRSGVAGTTLREAQNINKSLFHLEHVISQLAAKAKGHIAYRNSVLTSFLKDSLGGSCKTVMVANISLENQNFKESVSTCRFAQRCGQLRTNVSVNQYSIRQKPDVPSTFKIEPKELPALCLPSLNSFSSFPLSPNYEAVTLFELKSRCNSSSADFASLKAHFRLQGMQYKVRCVADLCDVLESLLVKSAEEPESRKVQNLGDLAGPTEEQPHTEEPVNVFATEMMLVTRHEWKKVIPSVTIEDLNL